VRKVSSGSAELPPLDQCCSAVQLETVRAGKLAVLVEVIVDRRVDGGELLQTAHPPETGHCPFPSSKWQMCVLDPVVQVLVRLPSLSVAQIPHHGSVGPKLVRHDHVRAAVALEQFPKKFQRCLAVPALRDESFQHFALVIDRPPQIACFTVDLHKHLIEMPSPVDH
jgi:hypothetical protein